MIVMMGWSDGVWRSSNTEVVYDRLHALEFGLEVLEHLHR
jgi:hypothetical protein